MTNYMDPFDHLLDSTLRTRTAAPPPAGMEQRLIAHIANAGPKPVGNLGLFSTTDRVNTRWSRTSFWTAIIAHAAVFWMIFYLFAQPKQYSVDVVEVASVELPPPPPLPPMLSRSGGGGGQAGATPASQGHLPKLSQEQLMPPKAPPLEQAKLAVEPSVVVQKDLKMADNKMPDLGMPNSTMKGFSMGNGTGSGIGSGSGNGIGPGSGGNTGGGPMHIGGSVLPPSLLFHVDPEFSEEARKAKFSGDVQVYLWVDEQGNPSHVKVIRGVGMGLDEKAVEAVRQYKFKPAMRDGKPVKVDLYVNVNFQIF
jgi:protein TonB